MTAIPPAAPRPRLGIGTLVSHPSNGRGKIVAYEDDNYVILCKSGDVRRVPFGFEHLVVETAAGTPELDLAKQALREVMQDYGFLEAEVEIGKRWLGGTLRMIPGKGDTQAKDVPIEAFLKKIIGLRDKLRVLEQKINAHPALAPEDKLDLQGYITRCYGSLTTFNALFAEPESQFKGQGKEE